MKDKVPENDMGTYTLISLPSFNSYIGDEGAVYICDWNMSEGILRDITNMLDIQWNLR